jgi:hypothetical protein
MVVACARLLGRLLQFDLSREKRQAFEKAPAPLTRRRGRLCSVGELPKGSEQPVQMPERRFYFLRAQVAPADRRMQTRACLSRATSRTLVPTATRTRVGVGAFGERLRLHTKRIGWCGSSGRTTHCT